MREMRRIRGWKRSTIIDIEYIHSIKCHWYINEGSITMVR